MKLPRLVLDVRTLGLGVLLCSILVTAQLDKVVIDDDLEGPNVCKEVEQFQLFVTAPREVTYQERYQKWCVAVPPRCSAYRVKTKIVNDTTSVTKERILKKCCVGYEKNKAGDRCVPSCSEGCKHGECIAPETCRCDQGYVGKTCNINCPPNRWGSDCGQKCQCRNNSTCNAQDGSCSCPRGYQGDHCQFQCPSDRFGQGCEELCQCLNGGKCDPVSGECYCAPGFTGPLCAQKCPEGKHGEQCRSDCRCQNGGSCDPQTGVRCESRCPLGYYGESCNEICTCHNNSSCDPISGDCICSRGWTGPSCNEPCEEGFFGHGCKERCPDSTYGNTTCDHITGKYSCQPGYIGTTCEHPCPSGTYGPECRLKCTCRNGGECSHETGMCQCPPGWTGANCEEVCPNGFYGPNCSQKCNCKNNAKCRKNDGQCICDPGWMGNRCDEVCPEGFYGNHCMESCDCPPGNFVCHAARGCVCSLGYYGDKCDKSRAEAKVYESENSSNAGLAWGLVLAVVFVGVIVALVLYYRRRVANLKAEVSHVVNYFTEEQPGHFDNPVYSAYQGQPPTNVTATGTVDRNGTHSNGGLLANGSLIRNNLRNPKSNLDKYRYPENESVGTDRSYSIQYLSESKKNFDADMTNPNYNGFDEKDHVYDEIKHKDGYKDLDAEYDHLDYSRPGSSHKTHYFRMNNPLTNSPKEINVLRENGTINNLSSPGLSSRKPLVSSLGVPTSPDGGSGADCGSSSSNSSPTPPPFRTVGTGGGGGGGTDSSNLYVKMSSERSSPAGSDHECNIVSSKIPEHQLNIK
ncbi:protein draper isoform X3 [Toxorhynchites rutilus septentrionalis]|uniref:protein draper isoform X3 n=1 Tax=Toxorhynchites rutilus septentrionalis TaxID=329112 RepID=UPI00247AB554|nr:protein draper isoform X3 [Toxorhynchites rutilus septentrionalis]